MKIKSFKKPGINIKTIAELDELNDFLFVNCICSQPKENVFQQEIVLFTYCWVFVFLMRIKAPLCMKQANFILSCTTYSHVTESEAFHDRHAEKMLWVLILKTAKVMLLCLTSNLRAHKQITRIIFEKYLKALLCSVILSF